MTNSLQTRVARVIAASAPALLNKLEDAAPVALMEQSLRERVRASKISERLNALKAAR